MVHEKPPGRCEADHKTEEVCFGSWVARPVPRTEDRVNDRDIHRSGIMPYSLRPRSKSGVGGGPQMVRELARPHTFGRCGRSRCHGRGSK